MLYFSWIVNRNGQKKTLFGEAARVPLPRGEGRAAAGASGAEVQMFTE